MKHDYTGRFSVGDTVYLNDKSSLSHHRQGTVTEINLSGRGYPYRVDFGTTHVYHPESELLVELPQSKPMEQWESMDISSGLGIGGYGSDDYNIWTERDTTSYPERDGCKWGGTRYDEACANCGRVTAICNDCELCEKCHG